MIDEKYEKEQDSDRPTHLRLSLGLGINDHEYTGNTTNFNMFSSALPVERMQRMTMAGDEECGAAGDFLSWEEMDWKLHSKARIVEVNKLTEGPCREESKLHVFTAFFENHQDCMHHFIAKRLLGGDLLL